MSKTSRSARGALCAALAVVLFFSFSFPASAAPVEESVTDGISFPTNTIFFPSDSDYVYISDSAPLKFKKRHYGHYLFACTFQAGGTFVGNTSGYCFQGNFYVECNGIRYYFYPSFNGDGVTYLEFALDLFDQNTVSVGYEGYVVRTVVNSPTAYFTYKMNLMFTYTLYQEGQTPIQYLAGIDGHLVDINNTIVSGVNNLYNMGGAIAGKLDGLNNTVDMGLGTVNSSVLKSGSDIVSALSGLSGIGSGVSSGNKLLEQGNQLQSDANSLLREGNELSGKGNQLQQAGNDLAEKGNQLVQQGNQLQQQTNQKLDDLTHGYDSSVGDKVNSDLSASLDEYDAAEGALIDGSLSHIEDVDFPSFFEFAVGLTSALSFVQTFADSFLLRSGPFGSVVPFMYALILLTVFVGIWRFRR